MARRENRIIRAMSVVYMPFFMAEVYEHVARIDHILKFILRKDLFLSYFSFKCNTFEYLCKKL